jgi:hypothetical protein
MRPARPSRPYVLAATGVAAAGLAATLALAPDGAVAAPAPGRPTLSALSVTPITPVDLDRRQALAASADIKRKAALKRAAAERAAQAAAARAAQVRAAEERASRSRRLAAAPTGTPRGLALAMMADWGWGNEFDCLNSLWERESGWSVSSTNATSGAYGIPQALPAGKMASAGADWQTNPATQIRWGLGYIADRYGSPCSAWSHSQSFNWY